MAERALECIEEVWRSVDALSVSLEPGEWERPTDCPGWRVRDQLAHMCGTESLLLGRPQPELLTDWPPHVRDAVGAFNESQVLARGTMTPAELIEEFRDLTAERLAILRSLNEETWAAETDTFLGRRPMREFIGIRTLDCVYHEQDMRLATGRPGGLDGEAARLVLERMRTSLPMIVARRAKAPDGSTVVFDVSGEIGGATAVGVSGGRGTVLSEIPADPAATLGFDLESFLRLLGGRWTAERALAEGRVTAAGDESLSRSVLGAMTVTP